MFIMQVRDMENILGRDREMDVVREELEAYYATWQVRHQSNRGQIVVKWRSNGGQITVAIPTDK